MDDKHYTEEELKLFLDPKFVKENHDQEWEILGHLKACEACSGLAKQAQEGMWGEIRKEFKGR